MTDDRFRTECSVCKGKGKLERVGYAHAIHMDSGEPPCLIVTKCHRCQGTGRMFLPVEEIVAIALELDRESEQLRGLIAQMREHTDDRD